MYDSEIKRKQEIYEQNIRHLNKTHQEEVKKIRICYENKIDEIIKTSEGVSLLFYLG